MKSPLFYLLVHLTQAIPILYSTSCINIFANPSFINYSELKDCQLYRTTNSCNTYQMQTDTNGRQYVEACFEPDTCIATVVEPMCLRKRNTVVPPSNCAIWYDGCSTCVVGKNSDIKYSCTKMTCESYENPTCRVLESDVKALAKIPDPYLGCELWFDGCNDCQITESGTLGTCTDKACFVQGTPKCLSKKIPDGCVQWFDGCNTCTIANSFKKCTKKYCGISSSEGFCMKFNPDLNFERNGKISPQAGCKSFFDGCATCLVSPSGESTNCQVVGCSTYSTQKYCLSMWSESECSIWYDGCNICRFIEDSLDVNDGLWICTDIQCQTNDKAYCIVGQTYFSQELQLQKQINEAAIIPEVQDNQAKFITTKILGVLVLFFVGIL